MIIDLNSAEFKKVDKPESERNTHQYIVELVFNHPDNYIPQGVMSGLDFADYGQTETTNDNTVTFVINFDDSQWKWDSNDLITWTSNEFES